MANTYVKIRQGSDEWISQAACRDMGPDTFFIDYDKVEHTDILSHLNKAQSVCINCSVQEKCLDYAIYNNIRHGMWGGLSEKKRRAYRLSNPERYEGSK